MFAGEFATGLALGFPVGCSTVLGRRAIQNPGKGVAVKQKPSIRKTIEPEPYKSQHGLKPFWRLNLEQFRNDAEVDDQHRKPGRVLSTGCCLKLDFLAASRCPELAVCSVFRSRPSSYSIGTIRQGLSKKFGNSGCCFSLFCLMGQADVDLAAHRMLSVSERQQQLCHPGCSEALPFQLDPCKQEGRFQGLRARGCFNPLPC